MNREGAKENKMHMNETERLEEEKCELLGIIQGKVKESETIMVCKKNRV